MNIFRGFGNNYETLLGPILIGTHYTDVHLVLQVKQVKRCRQMIVIVAGVS